MARAVVQMASSGTSRPDARSRALRSRGVKMELLVSTRNGLPCVAPLPHQFGCPGQRLVLVHEHAVHVGQPAFDVVAIAHAPIVLSGVDSEAVEQSALAGAPHPRAEPAPRVCA